MRTLLENSIWAHDAIPADEWKYRNLKRVMFPVIDLLFFLAGIIAAADGVPAISEFFPDDVVDTYSLLLSFVALICLVGVAFPSLWGLEIFGKSILFGLMVGYSAALLLLAVEGTTNRSFVAIVSLVALCPIVWRLSLLGSEWQARRLSIKGG